MTQPVTRRYSVLLTAACLSTAGLVLAAPLAQAQTTPAPAQSAATDSVKPLVFDAISIKPDNGGTSVNNQGMISSRVMMRNPPDGFSAANVNVRQLIANAYDVKEDQISGGPDWVGSKGYDIDAKVTGTDPSDPHQLSKAQRSQALQALLADRFKLALHTETKEASIYALTVAKSGPKLQESKPSEVPPSMPSGAVVRGPDGGVQLRLNRIPARQHHRVPHRPTLLPAPQGYHPDGCSGRSRAALDRNPAQHGPDRSGFNAGLEQSEPGRLDCGGGRGQ